MKRPQRGGFAVGLVVGLLIGLGVALAVALYVTKAPIPFINKVPLRNAEQDAAEAERNKHWDPNAPLAGKTPARPAAVASISSTRSTPVMASVMGCSTCSRVFICGRAGGRPAQGQAVLWKGSSLHCQRPALQPQLRALI